MNSCSSSSPPPFFWERKQGVKMACLSWTNDTQRISSHAQPLLCSLSFLNFHLTRVDNFTPGQVLRDSPWSTTYFLAYLSGCVSSWLHHVGSSTVGTDSLTLASGLGAACGLSCSMACGILVLPPEIKLVPPALQGRFPTTGPPGKSLVNNFSVLVFIKVKHGHN